MTRTELEDLLLDLKHDLGKHLAMPVTFLPADASAELAHQALRRALLQTRSGPSGVQSARALWQAFVDEAAGQLEHLPAHPDLCRTVARALAWEHVARAEAADFDRARALGDLRAVSTAIQAVLEELHGQVEPS
ncbi:MAG: hypothetical protein ABIJ09_05235 [Pseudomonadota bacterium]